MNKILLVVSCVFTVVLFDSCVHENKNNSKNEIVKNSFLMPTAENDSLVHNLALFISDAVEKSDAQLYLTKFAFNDFVKKVTKTDSKDDLLNNYRRSFEKGFKGNAVSIPLEIMKLTADTGFYDYLYNLYDHDQNRYSILFRLYDEETGINYHEYQVVKKDGELYFDDIFVYTTGEFLSESSKNLYILSLPENLLDKFLGQSKSNADIAKLYEGLKAQQNMDFQKSYDAFEKVSGDIRTQKIYHVLKMKSALQIDDSTYLKCLNEMVNLFSDDPTTKLLMIDYYFLKNDYENCMLALNDLENITQDSFLNYIKGNVAFNFGKIEEAEKFFSITTNEYPQYIPAKMNLASIYSIKNELQSCIDLLDNILETDSLIYKDEIVEYIHESNEEGELFNNLINSTNFQQWKVTE